MNHSVNIMLLGDNKLTWVELLKKCKQDFEVNHVMTIFSHVSLSWLIQPVSNKLAVSDNKFPNSITVDYLIRNLTVWQHLEPISREAEPV